MTVEFLEEYRAGDGRWFRIGELGNVPEGEARVLIRTGRAREVKPMPLRVLVRFLRFYKDPSGRYYREGQLAEFPEAEAQRLIADGFAREYVPGEPEPSEEDNE